MTTECPEGPLQRLVGRLRGRAQFLRDKSRVKSPELMEHAADEIERLQADAARYRYLRDGDPADAWSKAFEAVGGVLRPEVVDAEVDAAMQADQPPNG